MDAWYVCCAAMVNDGELCFGDGQCHCQGAFVVITLFWTPFEIGFSYSGDFSGNGTQVFWAVMDIILVRVLCSIARALQRPDAVVCGGVWLGMTCSSCFSPPTSSSTSAQPSLTTASSSKRLGRWRRNTCGAGLCLI